jgi:hypothetical protein
MPKARIIKLCALTAALWGGVVLHAFAQPVLDQVINQTKQAKLRQIQGNSSAGMVNDQAQPMQLWSISGINNKLVGEIWQGDAIQRLPLRPGTKLPNGWQIQAADSLSVTLRRGSERQKLYPTAPGSTGWEFAQTPRVSTATPAQLLPPMGPDGLPSTPQARLAASSLPPMPRVYDSQSQTPSGQMSSTVPQRSPAPVAAPVPAPR